MRPTTRRLLYWAPRTLAILFALFVSLFAMDVFNEGYTFPDLMLALLMHLFPTALVIAALIVAWCWEWVGAILFIGLGAWYSVSNLDHPNWILVIAGPLFLTGLLFLLNWFLHDRLRRHSSRSSTFTISTPT